MFAKARSRSASVTSWTWSNRARAVRTWAASVSGSARRSGKAKTLSGRSLRSAVVSLPWTSWGFQVGRARHDPHRSLVGDDRHLLGVDAEHAAVPWDGRHECRVAGYVAPDHWPGSPSVPW